MAKIKNNQIIEEDKKIIENLLLSGFGRMNKNELILHYLEAAYLVDLKLLDVYDANKKKLSVDKILKLYKSNSQLSAQEQYLIYKEIRMCGRVIRFNIFEPNYWFVYAPGVGREEERAQILLKLIDQKAQINLAELESSLALARQFRMEFMYSFIKNSQPQFIKLTKFSFL
jgi:tRNA splicing endonuclease